MEEKALKVKNEVRIKKKSFSEKSKCSSYLFSAFGYRKLNQWKWQVYMEGCKGERKQKFWLFLRKVNEGEEKNRRGARSVRQ